jgi:hypothetical protein
VRREGAAVETAWDYLNEISIRYIQSTMLLRGC